MRLRVIDQGEATPLASHAVPYGIAHAMAAGADPVLTLCVSEAPYVSVGAHQDLAREIDEDWCRARGIAVLRREVGGGAVLIDRDQLYFHFVFPRRLAPERAERLFPRFVAPVLATYADLGIAATHRPLNDVEAGGRKLGATAAAEIGEAVVIAGSFLFDFDRETMARALRVPDDTFRDLLRRSLVEHMATMRDLLPVPPAREQVKERFLGHVAATFAVEPAEDRPTASETAAIDAAFARHADTAWTHRHGRKLVTGGVKIAEGVHLTEGERRTAGGRVRVRLVEQDGRIRDLALTGEVTCLPADGLARLAMRLTGLALDPPAEIEAEVARAVGALGLDLPGISASEIAETIRSARAA
jgi:lipoate-protein ligase A